MTENPRFLARGPHGRQFFDRSSDFLNCRPIRGSIG